MRAKYAAFLAFLRRLNTHLVAAVGLISIVIGSFADPQVQSDAWALVAAVQDGRPLTPAEAGRILMRAVILAGAIAAYLGRPKTVPADPPAPTPPGAKSP